MLGENALDLVGIGRNEPAAWLARHHRLEARPAGSAAPQCGDAAVEHHRRPVACALEIDRLKVLRGIEAEPVHDIAAEDHQARAAGTPGDRLALEIGDRAVGTVGADHEQPGSRIHRRQHLEVRRRPADAGQGFVNDLALDQGDIEAAGLEHRHVLGAALGVDRLDLETGILRLDRGDEGVAIDGKAATRRRRAEPDLHRLRPGRGAGESSRYQQQGRASRERHGTSGPPLLQIIPRNRAC